MPETNSTFVNDICTTDKKAMVFLDGKPMLCKILAQDDVYYRVEMGAEDKEVLPYLVPKMLVSLICEEGETLLKTMQDDAKKRAEEAAKQGAPGAQPGPQGQGQGPRIIKAPAGMKV